METAIRAILMADSSVTDITTIFAPHTTWRGNDLPAMTYTVTGGTTFRQYRGVSDTQVQRLQIDCHAQTYSQAKLLIEAVTALLASYDGIQSGYEISCRQDNEFDQPGHPAAGRETPRYTRSAVFEILHREV
jgi:hypothetical protein